MLLVYGYYAFLGLGLAVLLIPRPPNLRALGGIRGYTVDDAPQPDARDTVSARNRLRQGTEEYNEYYSRHPERKEVDDKLRKMGRVGGAVDGGYRPNLAMSRASFRIPSHMGSIAYADPLEGRARVEEFCTYCMKCADTYPSNSISKGGMTVYHGVEKWKLQAETCSEYWNVVGTDCAICMAICPFSKPDTPMHSVVRWFVKHSKLAPRLFPIFDDILYGKKCKTKPVSPWLEYNQKE